MIPGAVLLKQMQTVGDEGSLQQSALFLKDVYVFNEYVLSPCEYCGYSSEEEKCSSGAARE